MTQNSACDWSGMQLAFPLKIVEVDTKLLLRPLIAGDLGELCDFMIGDADMTWTRTTWNRENVAYLLSLRLAHYKDFGFGPYGVLIDGKLQGMAGVQNWAEAPCSVEILVYLAKSEWSKGIGTKLLNFVIERVKDVANADAIYAATRPENIAANALAQRRGFRQIGSGIHFGSPATKWVLNFHT